jgi:putative transposase
MAHVEVGDFVVMPNHVHGIVVIRERAGDVRGRAMDGVVGVGARHDAPGMGVVGARGSTDNVPDAPPAGTGTGMPDGGPDTSDAPGHHTRARHDAPRRDSRKPSGVPRGALGQIVASYKSAVTRIAYREGLVSHGIPVWQRNYWDRIIRDDGEWMRIAEYIRDNPKNWGRDRFNKR